jgi:hypothetical protein
MDGSKAKAVLSLRDSVASKAGPVRPRMIPSYCRGMTRNIRDLIHGEGSTDMWMAPRMPKDRRSIQEYLAMPPMALSQSATKQDTANPSSMTLNIPQTSKDVILLNRLLKAPSLSWHEPLTINSTNTLTLQLTKDGPTKLITTVETGV